MSSNDVRSLDTGRKREMKVQLLMSYCKTKSDTSSNYSGYILVLKMSEPTNRATDSAFQLSIIYCVVQNQEIGCFLMVIPEFPTFYVLKLYSSMFTKWRVFTVIHNMWVSSIINFFELSPLQRQPPVESYYT